MESPFACACVSIKPTSLESKIRNSDEEEEVGGFACDVCGVGTSLQYVGDAEEEEDEEEDEELNGVEYEP